MLFYLLDDAQLSNVHLKPWFYDRNNIANGKMTEHKNKELKK